MGGGGVTGVGPNAYSLDIIFGAESCNWLSPTIHSNEVFPHKYTIASTSYICKDLKHLIKEYNFPMWIGGDINLPNIDRQNNSSKSGSYLVSFCNTFLEL